MFIPFSTDAPLYHLPLVTGGVIIANIAIFFATTFQVLIGTLEPDQIDWLLIQFNQINPLQWLTGSFMHLGFGHLLGNMFFLFCFGLVVEGKLGNVRFLVIYLAACATIGAMAQVPMYFMGSEDAAAGASGVISTLMVIAFFWAPENEITFFYWIAIVIAGTFEVSIMTVCVFFIGMDLLSLIFSGFSMSGEMGHILGALLGIPIAIVCLRTGMVDCEGWDLISRNDWLQQYPLLYGEKQRNCDKSKTEEIDNPVAAALAITGGDVTKSQLIGLVSNRRRQPPQPTIRSSPTGTGRERKKRRRTEVVSIERLAEKCQSNPEFNRLAYVIRQGLQKDNLHAAQQAFLKLDSMQIGLGLDESTLMRYASELGRNSQWVNAIRPLALVIEKRGSMADDACLRLAQIQLKVLKRHDHAIQTLEKIQVPEEHSVDAAKHERLQKRDELLRIARSQT